MTDPITASVGISMGLAAAGGVVGGLGAKESGEADAAAYRYKAGVALLNKQVNEQNAAWATQAGGIQGQEYGMKARQEIAATKAAQSGSNLDVNSGSLAAVRKSQTDVAQFDEGIIRWDAAKTSYGYEVKAMGAQAESDLDKAASSQSEIAGGINMITSFLNAGSSVSSKWMQGKTAGAFA